jgi:hypothetical protein
MEASLKCAGNQITSSAAATAVWKKKFLICLLNFKLAKKSGN